MAKNSLKQYNVTASNVFLTQKMAKTAKTRIFPDTTLPFDNSEQLYPVSDQTNLISGFEENVRKPDF